MIIVSESAASLKEFLANTGLDELARIKLLLARETKRGKFLFLIDATLVSQAGKKTKNTYSTGNRGRNPASKTFDL